MTANVEIQTIKVQPSTAQIGESILITVTIVDLDIANYPYNYPHNYQRPKDGE